MSGSRCSPSPWLQLIPEGLQICGIRRTWRSCPSPDHKAASCARDPGELMCHRQLARSLPRVERRCRFLLMAGRPRERSAAALSIVPIWPPVYYYLAGSMCPHHPFPRDQSLGGPSEAANSKWHLGALGILRHHQRF